MLPAVRAQYDALRASPAWTTLTTVENSILNGDRSSLPVAQQQWRDSATQVAGALVNLYIQQSSNATTVEIDTGNRMLITSIVAGAAAVLLAIIVSIIAWRLSSRLIRRLGRLRAETLEIADTQLPALVSRVRGGEDVDLVTEMSFLDHGDDEIGQVADAFNKAQQTAVAAAVDEAKTREGTSRVFLNIAHRSQVLVHRQLKALDEAERKQEDPDQLDLLFKLDHLSTRARRNAENLIILGGERPGRQWRNPVALADLIRAATGEIEDYARVKVGKVPELAVNGPVVGDVIHLLAELLDNATSFSPPTSRVEIWAEVVGRGVVIEVEDQGVGIEQEQVEELNATLKDPPNFSVMALSVEPRLGLFVVAQLAARHGITVTLRESAYGGTRAIVLVRSDLLTPVPQPEEPLEILPAIPVPAQQGPSTRHPSVPLPLPQNGLVADATTQVDLFRPQHRPSRPQLPPARNTRSPQPSGPLSADRPQLPRRRRQENLAPQLQANESLVDDVADLVDDPHQARSRLTAFQQGTRRAREQDPAATDFLGEHS
jgi:signal transduction histidine kinase